MGRKKAKLNFISTLMPLSIGISKMQLLLSMTAAFGNFKISIATIHNNDICHVIILRGPKRITLDRLKTNFVNFF